MKRLIYILIVISFMSCESEPEWEECVIKESEHYSNAPYMTQTSKTLRVEYMFDESIRYDIGEDQSDKCKLFGIGKIVPNWKHLSFRHSFWYDPSIDSIRIGAYVRDTIEYGDKPKKVHILNVGIYEKFMTEIEDCDSFVRFNVNEKYVEVKVSSHNIWLYGIPRPYFGGNCVAQNDITIKYKMY